MFKTNDESILYLSELDESLSLNLSINLLSDLSSEKNQNETPN
jgi:hypothetical protein